MSENPSDAACRAMVAAELPRVLDWAAAEGWNPGLDDAPAFHAADPGGFFVAEQDGTPVAAISVVNHSDSFAFLGLYICRPEYRGRGIGLALWQHSLSHAGGRVLGLDGVPDQQANYRRSGFRGTGQTHRFSGAVRGAAMDGVRPLRAGDTDTLVAIEARANGYEKSGFLRHWLADTATRKTLVADRGGAVAGFATIRRCRQGCKIGPLVAETQDDARGLIHAAAAFADGAEVIVDVPDDQPALMDYCASLDLTAAFHTARMYRGAAPVRGRAIRTIATLELG